VTEARKMVLLYNHADPDESFVALLTDEEIAEARQNDGGFSRELYDKAESMKVDMPSICYYA
jgi:hypothetical protein